MKYIKKYIQFKKAGCNIFIMLFLFIIRYIISGNIIISKQGTIIKGLRKIITKKLFIGTNYNGLLAGNEKTLIRVNKLFIADGKCLINQGCKIDVEGILHLNNVTINKNTEVVCSNYIFIGDHTMIGWDCLLIDNNFHDFYYNGIKSEKKDIFIGQKCWIASKCIILPGTEIADGCIVSAGSIVKGKFKEKNCLIAGNPAIIVKRNVYWS